MFGDRPIQLLVRRHVGQLHKPGSHPYRIGADHARDPRDCVVGGGAKGADLDQISGFR